MKFFLVMPIILFASWEIIAAPLPLFQKMLLPDGNEARLQDVVDHLREISLGYQEYFEASNEINSYKYFEEYKNALIEANPAIAPQIPESVFHPLLEQTKDHIKSKSTRSYIQSYQFLIYQALRWGASLPKDIELWEDEVLITGISFLAEKEKISVINLSFYLRSLHDPKRKFELLLNILYVYQFKYTYSKNKAELGYKFKELLAFLLKTTKWTEKKENEFLELSFANSDGSIFQWYKRNKISFNLSLYKGPSIFCYNTIGMIQRHIESPEFVSQNDVLKRVKTLMLFGANLNAVCIGETLKQTLTRWKKQDPKSEAVIDLILEEQLKNNII